MDHIAEEAHHLAGPADQELGPVAARQEKAPVAQGQEQVDLPAHQEPGPVAARQERAPVGLLMLQGRDLVDLLALQEPGPVAARQERIPVAQGTSPVKLPVPRGRELVDPVGLLVHRVLGPVAQELARAHHLVDRDLDQVVRVMVRVARPPEVVMVGNEKEILVPSKPKLPKKINCSHVDRSLINFFFALRHACI